MSSATHDEPPGPPSPGATAAGPDRYRRMVSWLLSVVVGGFLVNVASAHLQSGWPILVLLAVFLGAVYLTWPSGPLHRAGGGQTRGARLLAGLAGLAYLAVTVAAASRGWPLPLLLLSTFLLWATCVTLAWQTLRARLDVAY